MNARQPMSGDATALSPGSEEFVVGPQSRRRVLVIGQLDGFGNSLKPVAIARFLRERGHQVRLVDTSGLSRASTSAGFRGKLPAPDAGKIALYVNEVLSMLIRRYGGRSRHFLSYYTLVADQRIRRAVLRRALPLDDFDLVICETPNNAWVLTAATKSHTMYDCPTPWADDVHLQGKVTERQHVRLRRREIRLCESVDHLAFHWDSYARYAREQYGLSGRNLMTLNFGCTPADPSLRARFEDPPRIVYLGHLGLRFIDLPLLARLSALYPIDVYGGPPPDPKLGLRYLGYGTPDSLRNYQMGLITCSQDLLMKEGFSAKHLTYLAHGLPVLVPAWRRNVDVLRGTVTYTEATFRQVVDGLGDRALWQAKSDEAYEQAHHLSWDRTLLPLDSLLQRVPRVDRPPCPVGG
ncbi:hypothetical protein [Streptomyces sp. NPDC005485]|uniref:hypothetical protein n=1 Tax=Streptomyces sp. NPDC005485 TaxID=3155591 RepID=UPI0033A7B634